MSIKGKRTELFFPYYINQGRLLDIYAILNGGYSEYQEISTAISQNIGKSGKADVSAGGSFKLFNFGGTASAAINKDDAETSQNVEKKVQTVTSVLSIVQSSLKGNGYLKDVLESQPGDFICVPVVLSINSVKSLMNEIKEVVTLASTMDRFSNKTSVNSKAKVELDKIMKCINPLFNGEEVLYENEEFALFGNIIESNLYQGQRADLVGNKLKCLAQVKRVYPEGTELMKNTLFSKIKDKSQKDEFIKAMAMAADKNLYDYEAVAVTSIQDKPVYELEIIALYQ